MSGAARGRLVPDAASLRGREDAPSPVCLPSGSPVVSVTHPWRGPGSSRPFSLSGFTLGESGSSADSPGTLVDFHGSPRSPPESSVSAACALLVAVALVTEPEKAIREMLNPCGCTATPPDWQSSRGSQPITRERRTPSGTTAGVSPSAVGSLTCLPGAKYEQGPARARENVAAGKQAGELSRGIPWTPESRTPSRPCVRRCGKGALPECQPGDPSLSQIGKGFLQCLELRIEVKCSRPPVLADFHGFGNNLRIINI